MIVKNLVAYIINKSNMLVSLNSNYIRLVIQVVPYLGKGT